MPNQLFDYHIEILCKQIKEAKETNNLKREKILKGFTRLLSIFNNIYKIMENYEDCDEFEETRCFYSYVTQIFFRYLENYIEGKKISLERLKIIVDCLAYKYAFYGGGFDQRGNSYLSLGKCVGKDEDDFEDLDIPIPITKTDKWYNDLKFINNRENLI